MKRALERIEIPGEPDARERTWRVAEAAFADRQPAPRRSRRTLAVACSVVVAGSVAVAAFSSPGHALLRSIRETVGVRASQPALFSLPAAGQLLVHSDSGIWVVQADGSKRRLGAYASASWSPHGLYVAATRRNSLYALTPDGEERWSLARSSVRFPRWTGSRTDTRIAYVKGSRLRLVAGDGAGDYNGCAGKVAAVAPAWQPGRDGVLALVESSGAVLVYRVDSCTLLWRARAGGRPTKLEWSTDGRFLLAFARYGLRVFDARGRVVAQDDPSDATWDTDATFLPGTDEVAVVRVHGAQSDVFLLRSRTPRTLFHVAGALGQLVVSPDGRWLIVAWPDADQWVFLRIRGARSVRAVANVSAQFRSQSIPRIEGWCCAP